jgi:hypothetical protein
VFVTAVPRTGPSARRSQPHAGREWRILAIDAAIDDELVDRGINAVFTVEQI